MAKKLSIRMKAIRCIEALCMEDFSFPSARELQDRLYKYAHVAAGSCKNPHTDWVKEVEELYEKLSKDY